MRAAYIVWKATPPNDRPPEIATLELFIKRFTTNYVEIAAIENEPDFDDAVMSANSHWKHKTHAIIDAIFQAAMTPGEGQLRNAYAFLRLVGDERADRIEHLIDD